MNTRWLLKAKRWAQNPPSPASIKFIVGIIVFCLILFGFEQLFGWPDWLTPTDLRRMR
ncbi:hypothetical protein C7964_102174 [Loktanella sp. PT4BL]|jgi:hypothetical protein|uniref:hypothetical protein n=1 Tax=Loktanella sp. PT4BL TaxID=2135611 RepID=UPI000D95D0F5|nr:hypothetical protein [Loktanella sp. PT4BL]PXW70289.1 hypothetical protein C7964_102174 [Loktanella sp. PT4BL]